MRLNDIIKRVEEAKTSTGEPVKPHLMTEDWIKWIEPHLTDEELKALEETITPILSSAAQGSCEYYEAEMLRRQIMRDAEDRAMAGNQWPAALRGHEEEYRTAISFERGQPSLLPNPCEDPPPGVVYGNYHRGFWPEELTVTIGSTVTWESREVPYVWGFHVIHQPDPGQEVEFDSRADESGHVSSHTHDWLKNDLHPAFPGRNEPARVFQHTFTKPGVYRYKSLGAKNPLADEGGTIIVLAGNMDPKELEQFRKIQPITEIEKRQASKVQELVRAA
jgi:plastocyanin